MGWTSEQAARKLVEEIGAMRGEDRVERAVAVAACWIEQVVRDSRRSEAVAVVVDHPKHYQHPSGVEAIDLCEWMSFNLGNAFKYLVRAGKKGDRRTDFEKARWYVRRELAQVNGRAPRLVPRDLVDRFVKAEPDAKIAAMCVRLLQPRPSDEGLQFVINTLDYLIGKDQK